MAVIKAVSSKAGIGQALDYVTKEEKTEDKLVSGLHCEPDTANVVVGLLGNESSDSNRFTLVTPKPENGVRLQATLGNQNPTGLPVRAVRDDSLNMLDKVVCKRVYEVERILLN